MNEQGFSRWQKWSFGMGSFAQWFVMSAFNTWVFTFYFSAVKLNVNLIMIAYITWTIWNAINDPLLGYISDRTRTRWGRRKPFIILGTIPVLIIEIILWIPPTGNPICTFIYLLIMLICYDTFYTMITFFDALFPELYVSVEERAEVNTIKQILATVGLLFAYLIPGIFIGDLTVKEGYLINGLVTSIIVGISLFIAIYWGVREKEEFKFDHQHEFNFFEGLKYAFKNRGFVLYTIMFFLYEYILLVLGTTVPLYATHVLHISNTFQISLLPGVMFVVGVLTVPIWRKLDVKFGSKKGYAISLVAYLITITPLLFVEDFQSAMITVVFMGFGFGGMLYFIYLIIADVIDEDELRTGVRREGTFFGVTNFFMRLAMILSIITVGTVFSTTGWEEYVPNPDVDVILGLKLLVFLFPALAIIATMICLYFYPFPKEKVEQMKKQLEELHGKKREKIQSHQ
ncbi:MAG: MFS transporter [Promethearchaeota archaeon]